MIGIGIGIPQTALLSGGGVTPFTLTTNSGDNLVTSAGDQIIAEVRTNG